MGNGQYAFEKKNVESHWPSGKHRLKPSAWQKLVSDYSVGKDEENGALVHTTSENANGHALWSIVCQYLVKLKMHTSRHSSSCPHRHLTRGL